MKNQNVEMIRTERGQYVVFNGYSPVGRRLACFGTWNIETAQKEYDRRKADEARQAAKR